MLNLWSDAEAKELAQQYPELSASLVERLYASRLLGREASLILHGGGNSSIKAKGQNIFGESIDCLYVKASGFDMAQLTPQGLPALELEGLLKLKTLSSMDDLTMTNQVRRQLLDPNAANPSIEALVHAWIPAAAVDHTHADAVLVLAAQQGGKALCQETFGPDFVVLDYAYAGFPLALAVAQALSDHPQAKGLVLMSHGIITWGEDAKSSYSRMIEAVTLAETKLVQLGAGQAIKAKDAQVQAAWEAFTQLGPVLRGMASLRSGRRFVALPLIEAEVLPLLEGDLSYLNTVPLTPDHLIRTKALPMIVEGLDPKDLEAAKEKLAAAFDAYAQQYDAYFEAHQGRLEAGLERFDNLPRMVLLPGVGAVALGPDVKHAQVTCDILRQTLAAKGQLARMNKRFEGLSPDHLFEMEYRGLQHHKLKGKKDQPLRGRVSIVTGAAGAIGAGICHVLAQEGSQLVFTDLPGENLERVAQLFHQAYPGQVMHHPMDVTSAESIDACFDEVTRAYGGIDLLVINAGLAHVSPLETMDLARFQLLEKVNVEGTLLMLSQGAKYFRRQAAGGDIVLVSTKNVFSPSANFGAYSATKAGSHQLARIASLEFADMDVRVNMVSPDGVFSDDDQVKSGLWATVGPDRMKARGLDEKGLEEYYRNRNLLKARVTARHVGHAVLYFATRQSPTSGATIPVDGGLPDATPR
ncbi:MAG: bifunctional aldolase/short-chain dehydrogenase [bacterium]|nr:bifunctional aldolase/short-chain dehydrogenase [bacterium]